MHRIGVASLADKIKHRRVTMEITTSTRGMVSKTAKLYKIGQLILFSDDDDVIND